MKFILLPILLVLPSLGAQVSADKSKIVIDDVDLQGAVHLPESAKRQLVVDLVHREYPENSAWVADVEDEAVRAETEGWPDRENQGYIGFSVGATFKTLRQEPGLRHVLVTIQLNEGKQKRLKAIAFRFVATQPSVPSFDTASLRKLIPLNDGEVYNRDKFYSGLDAVMHAYQGRGFVAFTSNVESQVDDATQTVEFVVELNEGKQYRWGNIQVVGPDPKMEMLLKTRMKMGSPVNPKLIDSTHVGHGTRLSGFSSELSLPENKRSAMRQSTNVTVTIESGQWNNRNSNVATTPKKIPPMTANDKARRKSLQGSNKRVRDPIHLGTKNIQTPKKIARISTCDHSTHVPTSTPFASGLLQESRPRVPLPML